MSTELDRIEREITIQAPASRVWSLISEPGWYINDGEIVEHTLERSGDVTTVHDPTHGTFRCRTLELDEPRYAAFRWLDSSDDEAPSTLVEFWIDEVAADTVVLRVAESGFASLSGSAEERRLKLESNQNGWSIELGLAQAYLQTALSPAEA